MTAESFVEHIREGQVLEEGIKKHVGGYRTKDVEQYVDKLHERLRNMEEVYQERFEEMRTSLIAMTRERDEQIENVRVMEQKIRNLPEQCELYIESQSLVTLPKDQYEKMQKFETNLRAEFANLTKKQALIEQENVNLIKELGKYKSAQADTEKINQELEQLRAKLQEYDNANEELNQTVLAQSEQYSQQLSKLESLEASSVKLAEELKQAQARYKSLELQYQLAQNTTQQLIQDKEMQDKRISKLQEHFDTERTMLVNRYRGILADQQQCMTRLQENFNITMQCMESLSENEIKPE